MVLEENNMNEQNISNTSPHSIEMNDIQKLMEEI